MDRSRLYKNVGKDEELRRRRIDQSVELRKAKKEQQLQKRRNVVVDLEEKSLLKDRPEKLPLPTNYDKIIADMKNSDMKCALTATQNCRKILSKLKNPPIDEFVRRGAQIILLDLLNSDNEDVMFEAAWALTNIASGDSCHTESVVKTGAVPKLIQLLKHPNIRIAEQCVWALGNVAGDGTMYRDMVIHQGVVGPALELLQRGWETISVVSNISWMLSNLCRNKNPDPPLATVQELLPVFARLLEYPYSEDVVADIIWALSYVSDCGGAFVDAILHSGCVSILVRYLDPDSSQFVTPSLRVIGNLILGTDSQTQAVIDCGVLQQVPKLLRADRSNLSKEACWMLSNIAAGSIDQIQQLIDAGFIPKILSLMSEADFRVQKEACWVISNIVTGGLPEHRATLLNLGVLDALSGLLKTMDVVVLRLVLDCLKKIFETAEAYNQLEDCCLALEKSGALTPIEELQNHQNEAIYNAAYNFISQYFSAEEGQGPDDNAKDNSVPSNQGLNEFCFEPHSTQPGSTKFEF